MLTFVSSVLAVIATSAVQSTVVGASSLSPPATSNTVGAVVPATVTAADYARAERFLPWNEDRYILNGEVQPHWIGTQDRLWYLRTTGGGVKEFVVVNAATGERTPAFDQKKLAAALATATRTDIDPARLPFSVFRYTHDQHAIQFHIGDALWTCQLATSVCTAEPPSNVKPDEALSPDGKWAVFLKDRNLWARSTSGGAPFALTSDGVEHYDYAGAPGSDRHPITDIRHPKPTPPQVLWSPDSRRVLSYRLDERQVKDMFLIEGVPEDGSLRPKLYTYRYPLPGDAEIPQQNLLVFDVEARRQVKFATPPLIMLIDSLITQHYAWWSPDGSKVYYLDSDRFAKFLSLNVADVATGTVRKILEETGTMVLPGDARAGANNDYPEVKILKNGDVIWYSERDGWGHLYYYNGATGKLRNEITHGNWTVRDIVRVDEAAGRIYFTAGSADERRDPYYRQLYSVNLDGSKLTLLTPEDADHWISSPERPFWTQGNLHVTDPDPWTPPQEKGSFSPSGRYFFDRYSRPDLPPVLVLRTATGKLVKQLETADITPLRADGYTPIEPFRVLAADGKTPIYGNVFRPSHFDPQRKYPIIDAIYPGPQIIRTGKDLISASFDPLMAPALAELGFIVVTIDGRGTPHRSRAFLDAAYGQMSKAGNLDDHVAGIRQLAQRYPYMDIERVGICGVSGGGYASTHAILSHPEFYKVAVSAEGNHNQLVYLAPWGETYNGPVGDTDYKDAANETFAANLKGKLLLMHGDLDDNVSPALTLRVVNALIKANKDFDLLIIPNGNHDIAVESTYFIRREWDYFVRNLLGAEPPAHYEIKSPPP